MLDIQRAIGYAFLLSVVLPLLLILFILFTPSLLLPHFLPSFPLSCLICPCQVFLLYCLLFYFLVFFNSDSSVLILPAHYALYIYIYIMSQSFVQNVSILVKFYDQISSSGANSPSAVGKINPQVTNVIYIWSTHS